MVTFKIIEGKDSAESAEYAELVALFIRNELEFSAEEPVATDLIKSWLAEADGKLVGGCSLAKRDGEFIIDGIALEPEYRKSSLGTELLKLAIEEEKRLGGTELFLVARAPGFFKKQGFEALPREGAPNFFECATCPQYNKTCFPEVMKKEL